jgi:hypothetical protein
MTYNWNAFLDGVAETGVTVLPAAASIPNALPRVTTPVRHPDPSLWPDDVAAEMTAIREGKL